VTVTGRGAVRVTETLVLAQLARGEEVDGALYYFRTTPRFETSAPPYTWLNDLITVAAGLRKQP